jgi:phosphoribosylformylglycinamidine synthase
LDLKTEELQEFGSSEFARTCLEGLWGKPPSLDLRGELQLQQALRQLAGAEVLHSARDVSEGGLAVSIAEACIGRNVGAKIDLVNETSEFTNGLPSNALFGEFVSVAIVTCREALVARVHEVERDFTVRVQRIGQTGGNNLEINLNAMPLISAPVADLRMPWSKSLEATLRDEVTA